MSLPLHGLPAYMIPASPAPTAQPQGLAKTATIPSNQGGNPFDQVLIEAEREYIDKLIGDSNIIKT
ncbi:MAG: hypothetical protein HQL52_03490 [Magnetococcales bacterium]|nr:hypothetical protein [Magnetococcales bacterium]